MFKKLQDELTHFLSLCASVFRLIATLAAEQKLKSIAMLLGLILVRFNKALSAVYNIYRIDYKYGYNPEALLRLHRQTSGLHQLLPSKISFSVLVPVYKPKIQFYEEMLTSLIQQTSPRMEILLGFDGPQPQELIDLTKTFIQKNQNLKIKYFEFDHGGISGTFNRLAKEAQGSHFLLMDHDDWIRPDLLFRYEQTLLSIKNENQNILFCDEFKIDSDSKKIPNSDFRKSNPEFPYFFINTVCHCLLVPKILWNQVGGLKSEYDGAQDYDLCLRLSEIPNVKFIAIPILLYAWRVHANSTALHTSTKSYAHEAGVKALQNYSDRRNLGWKIEDGPVSTSYKAIPATKLKSAHVIVPFKDQGQITIQCIEHLLKQKNVQISITAIDNASTDQSLRKQLEQMQVECLAHDEPFNFSRINNQAVAKSKYQNVENLLFLNNDVLLDEDALSEMLLWIDEPQIGIVGARLSYPDGRLQHGGIVNDLEGSARDINWSHREIRKTYDQLGFAKLPGTVPAVTGACLMIKKDLFHSLGGFDEVLFPIAYSDTDLCRRVQKRNLYCFYTPYAHGIHFESLTRKYDGIEDFEKSQWINSSLV